MSMEWNDWIALALVLAAIWATWLRLKQRRRLGAMAKWTRCEAKVLSHDIEATTSRDSYGDSSDHYEPKLTYAYQAGGETRTGSRLGPDGVVFSSRKAAETYLAERPIGSTVPAFVNPDDPNDAVLSVKAGQSWWVPLFFLLLAAAVAAGLFDGAAGEAG